MREVKVKFVIEDICDEMRMKRFMHGEDAIFLLHDYLEKLRGMLKYEEGEEFIPGLEKARDALFTLLEEASINLDDLVN